MSTTATQLLDRSEGHRRELTAFCYRFLGSWQEAEDAVQEVLVKAWRGADDFRGDASLRTWLYRIATTTCLDMRRAPQRRALPMDLAAPGDVPTDPATLATGPSEQWLGPIADDAWWSDDPAERVATPRVGAPGLRRRVAGAPTPPACGPVAPRRPGLVRGGLRRPARRVRRRGDLGAGTGTSHDACSRACPLVGRG